MNPTRLKRIPFHCGNCGFESLSATQITEGSHAGAYECPRCRSISQLERSYLSALVGGFVFAGIGGLIAIAVLICCLMDKPLIFSVLSGLPVAMALAFWLRPALARHLDKWRLLERAEQPKS